MSLEEENKQLVRKAISAFNAQDIDLYMSYHTSDYTSREVFFPAPLTVAQVRQFLPEYWHAYPDALVDTKFIYAEGDTVIVENVMSGTMRNSFMGKQATGRSFMAWEACVFDLEEGKIRAARVYTDQKALEASVEVSQRGA